MDPCRGHPSSITKVVTSVQRPAADSGWRERIVLDHRVGHGEPCIRGTRIPVSVILDNLAERSTVADILKSYPSLVAEDIYAAIAYAAELARETVVAMPAPNS